jgi:hypothetical protein
MIQCIIRVKVDTQIYPPSNPQTSFKKIKLEESEKINRKDH